MNGIAWLFLALTVVFTVVGQLLVKFGLGGIEPLGDSGNLLRYVLRAFTTPAVAVGLACAVIAAACWTLAVNRAPLSLAYPFMALAIVLVVALSPLVFGEVVPPQRWLGVLVVCVGLLISARGG